MSVSHANALILCVEDEFLIQEFIRTALEEAGFGVVVASSGAEALDRIRHCPSALGGMITDVNLGTGMKGWEIGRHARNILPQLPVIYMSGGGSEYDWDRQGVARSLMIAKPFKIAQLVSAMSSLIDARVARPLPSGVNG